MRIKMFEGFSDSYQEISVVEYNKRKSPCFFSKLDRRVLPDIFGNFKYSFKKLQHPRSMEFNEAFRVYVEHEGLKYIYFTIWKTDDDWYWVRYDDQDPLDMGMGVKFFKCDQLDGIRKLITDNPEMLVPMKH